MQEREPNTAEDNTPTTKVIGARKPPPPTNAAAHIAAATKATLVRRFMCACGHFPLSNNFALNWNFVMIGERYSTEDRLFHINGARQLIEIGL